MGLLDATLIDKRGSPIDTLSNYLSKRLTFGEYSATETLFLTES